MARRVTSARLPPLAGDRCLVPRGCAETGRGPWIPLAYVTPRASHPVRSPLPAQSCLPCHRKPGGVRPPERQPQLEPLLRGEGVGRSGEGPGQSAGLAALRRLGLRHQARCLLPGAPPGVAASEGAPLRAAWGRAEVCLPQEPAAGRGQSLQSGGPPPRPTGGSSPAARALLCSRASVPRIHCHLPGRAVFTLLQTPRNKEIPASVPFRLLFFLPSLSTS